MLRADAASFVIGHRARHGEETRHVRCTQGDPAMTRRPSRRHDEGIVCTFSVARGGKFDLRQQD